MKWWVDEVFAMLFNDQWLIEILFTTIALYYHEIPDDPQTNDELYTFSNFFNQGTNLQFYSRNIPMEALANDVLLLL